MRGMKSTLSIAREIVSGRCVLMLINEDKRILTKLDNNKRSVIRHSDIVKYPGAFKRYTSDLFIT
jgi:hypothetical protein